MDENCGGGGRAGEEGRRGEGRHRCLASLEGGGCFDPIRAAVER